MKSIICNTDEVQAILDRRKTQARRVMKLKSGYSLEGTDAETAENLILFGNAALYHNGEETGEVFKPRFKAGDIVFVKETWCGATDGTYRHKAGIKPDTERIRRAFGVKWRSPVCMPEEAARIFLRVTGVRVERLQDMNQEDCIKEGHGELSEEQYAQLWNSKIKKKDLPECSWEANPLVEVTEFEVISKEEAYGTG